MNFKLILFIVVFIGYNCIHAQNNTTQNQADLQKYNRSALSIIVLENKTEFNNDLKSASSEVDIPGKYDDNSLDVTSLKIGSKSSSVIKRSLEQKKIPNEILAKWFARNDKGEFDMSVIFDRGLYNATDDDVVKASTTKIGVAGLKDAGEKLIDHSYVLVLDYYGIKSMKEIYDKRDAAREVAAEKSNTTFRPVTRNRNGWEGKARAYLFKMNLNDSIINTFYDDMWIYEDDNDSVRLIKQAMFDAAEFPVHYIMQGNGSADGTQFKSGHILSTGAQLSRQQLFQKMITTGMNSVIEDIERTYAEFQVKTPVYKTRPIRAKIGKKEGLMTDHRYFVKETKQKKNGQIVLKRKAVVRVKKAFNNKYVAKGNSNVYSTFYKTSGVGVESGMTMIQKNDIGVGVSGGYSIGEMGGGYVKMELNMARMLASVLDIGITQLKSFGALALDYKDYRIDGTTYEMSFMRWQVGLSKGFYFGGNFSVAPLVAYGQEIASGDDFSDDFLGGADDANVTTDFVNVGGYATINIRHNIQLMGTFNYYIHVVSPYDQDKENIPEYSNYDRLFKDRKGMSIDLGIRIEI